MTPFTDLPSAVAIASAVPVAAPLPVDGVTHVDAVSSATATEPAHKRLRLGERRIQIPRRHETAADPVTVTVEVGRQTLMLLPEKAVLLPDDRTLLVADVHIGKAASFRRLGVPVPPGTTSETLRGLTSLVTRWQVRRIVFLGDLLHSAAAFAPATMAALARWRGAHPALALTLVRGNHDDRAGDPPAALGIDVVDEPLRAGGLALCHHPRPREGTYVLAGHLHPCVHLSGRAGDRVRLPCFWFGERVGVLPAFGAFTGSHPVRPGPGERLFAIADTFVRELPTTVA